MCVIKRYPQTGNSKGHFRNVNREGHSQTERNKRKKWKRDKIIATPKELATEVAMTTGVPGCDINMDERNIIVAPHELLEITEHIGMESLREF